jgi:uncharacterized protein (TIGR04141 family)
MPQGDRVPLQRLHVRLLKPDISRVDAALEDPRGLNSYEIRDGLGFSGRLYVAPPNQAPPPWLEFVQTGIVQRLQELTNRTNAAVLLARRGQRIFAFTFGHGRHLLRTAALVPDFGLKAALNGLQHDSLRSVDSFTLEDQPVHTRSQASRASGIEVFGLDVGRDILRAVTGSPRADVHVHTLSGGESTLSISANVNFPGLGSLCDELLALYRKRLYREHFGWVDNIRQVRDPARLEALDEALLHNLRREGIPDAYLAPPESIDWARIDGFAYTRRRQPIEPDVSVGHYLDATDRTALTIEQLRRDRIFVYVDGLPEPSDDWPVYRSIVFEHSQAQRRFVLINGLWFEVSGDFVREIRRIIAGFPVAQIDLPPVQRRADGRLEPEADYNRRAGGQLRGTAILDGKLARCRTASSGIEPCDLLTENRELVHVKHRKGGSSALSHLFAQARVAAEALVGDEGFRQDVRALLRDVRPGWENRVPVERPRASTYSVIFAILGTTRAHAAEELPFFSQLNLARTGEALLNLGFTIALRGVPIIG